MAVITRLPSAVRTKRTILTHFVLHLLLATLSSAQPEEEHVHVIPELTVIPLILPISTPGFCLSNADCPVGRFCKYGFYYRNQTCMPLLPAGAECASTYDCRSGLVCPSISGRSDITRCAPLTKPGGPCDSKCQSPYRCSDDRKKCDEVKPVGFGELCRFDIDCVLTDGFFCRYPRDFNKRARCDRKRSEGQKCDGDDCAGFCADQSIWGKNGICLSIRKPQSACLKDDECPPPIEAKDGPNSFFCNQPNGPDTPGTCESRSQVINKLGAPCFRGRDLCDRARDLRCRYSTDLRRNVCQHDPSVSANKFDNFCNSGSKFSRCASTPFENGRECRSYRFVPGRADAGPDPPLFPRCLRRRELVEIGESCEQEYAMCPPGSECKVIPGVRYYNSLQYGGFDPDRAVYCVKPRAMGESCENKFKTFCKDGLRCSNGTCVKGEKKLPSKNSHAFRLAECEEIPCTPGLVCERRSGRSGKYCYVPIKKMGRGQPCEDTALFNRKCEPGLKCMTNWDNLGTRLCRPRRRIGGYCEENSWCKRGLKCPHFSFYSKRNRRDSRCFDPAFALGIGKACDPQARIGEARCSFTMVSPPRGGSRDAVTLRCLAKGKGFACQIDAGLFGKCDPKLNRACDGDQLKCSSLGLCLPKGEVLN